MHIQFAMRTWIFFALYLVGYQIHDTLACRPKCKQDAKCVKSVDCVESKIINIFGRKVIEDMAICHQGYKT